MQSSYVEKILAEHEIPSTPELIKLIIAPSDEITIPNKASYNLKFIPKRELRNIHEDLDTAKELILITLSNLSNTWVLAQHSDDRRVKMGYKRLYSKILEEQVKYDPNVSSPYSRILKILRKHAFIEDGEPSCYKPHGKGRAAEYRLTNKYFGKGSHPYKLHSIAVKRMNTRQYTRNFKMVVQTHIGMNHLKMLTKVRWPSEEVVKKTIDQAVKDSYRNRGGKRLVNLGKHSQSEYPRDKFIYAEDYFNSFRYLRDNMKMPLMKEEWLRNGELQFRLATCFTLMPKLLRELITIGDHSIVENDYSTLHPNIVQSIYGGKNQEPVTHDGVAEYLNLSRENAKAEHLGFFNKRVNQMQQSPLWKYYWDKEPKMMVNIVNEKETHPQGHKATCWKIFAVEVRMMERSIQRLSELGVDVIYVYDALYSIQDEQETVRRVMNEVAHEMNILSRAC